MKKWILMTLIVALTAGIAVAQEAEKSPWWKFGMGKTEVKEDVQRQPGQAGRYGHPQMSPEQREQMKKTHAELKALAETARNETDPVKKEALIDQLRIKVTEVADKMQKQHRQRILKAERNIAKLKERMAEAEKNRPQMIEKRVQQLLSGEQHRPPRAPRRRGEGGRAPLFPEKIED